MTATAERKAAVWGPQLLLPFGLLASTLANLPAHHTFSLEPATACCHLPSRWWRTLEGALNPGKSSTTGLRCRVAEGWQDLGLLQENYLWKPVSANSVVKRTPSERSCSLCACFMCVTSMNNTGRQQIIVLPIVFSVEHYRVVSF